jgi:uncharacterized protein (DUF849 family)
MKRGGRILDIDEAMELVKAGKAVHYKVMFDKNGKITKDEEKMERFMETVYSKDGHLIIEVSGYKPTEEELEMHRKEMEEIKFENE